MGQLEEVAVDSKAERGSRSHTVEVAEDAAHLDALVISVIRRGPARSQEPVRVQIDREFLWPGERAHPAAAR